MSNQHIEAWIDALPSPALFIGADARISAANIKANSVLNEGIVGRNYTIALRQPLVLNAIETCRLDHSVQSTRYTSAVGRADTVFHLRCAYVAVPFDGVLVTFDDVTHIEQTAQMHRDFVANVSHELKTPLTSISGFIETLQGSAREDRTASERFLGIMSQEAARMDRLVNGLLTLSRVEAQQRLRPTEVVEIGALLASVVQNLSQLAQDQDALLQLEKPEFSMKVTGDADQLRQVFTNLVENAIKYGGQGVEVTLSCAQPTFDVKLGMEALRICVRDTGRGFDPIHIPRLTERFYRIDDHRSREMGGTGLGLAIAKHIIARHRGRLAIASVPQQGSEFTVLLPSTANT